MLPRSAGLLARIVVVLHDGPCFATEGRNNRIIRSTTGGRAYVCWYDLSFTQGEAERRRLTLLRASGGNASSYPLESEKELGHLLKPWYFAISRESIDACFPRSKNP